MFYYKENLLHHEVEILRDIMKTFWHVKVTHEKGKVHYVSTE